MIYGDIAQLVNFLDAKTDFVITKHAARTNVKDELYAFCHRKGLNINTALKQYDKYLSWGFDDTLGLSENGLLIMRHSDANLNKLLDDWYTEFVNEPIKTDQLSLMPCIHKNQYSNYKLVNGSVWKNQYFRVLRHKSK